MNTKTLLAGLIGFILGALLVSIAATTFEKDKLKSSWVRSSQHLSNKTQAS